MGICVCPEGKLTEPEVKQSINQQDQPEHQQEMKSEKVNKELIFDQQLFDEDKPVESKKSPPTFKERFDEMLPSFGEYAANDELRSSIKTLQRIDRVPPYVLKEEDQSNERLHKMDPVKFRNTNIYEGQWNEEFQMDGQGEIFLFKENIYAKGLWKKGAFVYGRVHFCNGSYYEGDIKDSKFNGKGVLVFEDGNRYEGKFTNGERHGKGKLLFPDGSIYEGDFTNDSIKGKGEFAWPNKTKYIGSLLDTMLDGYGVLSTEKGSHYDGFFSKTLFNGKGTFQWSNGEIYNGDYKCGIKEGKGTFTNSICTYTGGWRDNLPHGAGKVQQGSLSYTSYWRNGNCIETPEIISSSDDNLKPELIQPINFNVCIEDIDPLQLPHLQNEKKTEVNQMKLSTIVQYSPTEQISYD